MNPTRLRLEGVRRFAELDVAIPEGCVAITGANGSGKSTLLNAVELALFAAGSTDLAPLLAPWTDRLLIQLEFEHAGETYRVRRGYRQSGARGTATLDLEVLVVEEPDGSWLPLTREDTRATQAEIERIIGLSRRTFRASSFLAQGDGAAFTEASPADRKAVMGDALDPRGLWPKLADLARQRARTTDTQIATTRARAEQLDELITANAGLAGDTDLALLERDLATASVTEAEQRLEEAQAAETANAGAAERVRTAAAHQAAAAAALTRAREQAQAAQLAEESLPQARERLAELDRLIARIPVLEKAWRDQTAAAAAAESARSRKADAQAAVARQRAHVTQLLAAREAALNRRSQLADQLRHLQTAEDGTEACPTCAQTLGAEARARAIATMTVNLDAADRTAADQLAEIYNAQDVLEELDATADTIQIPTVPEGDTETPLQQARAAVERAATGRATIQAYEATAAELSARLEALRAASSDLDAKEQALTAASAGVKDTAGLAAAVQQARTTLTARRQSLANAAALVARLEERAAQVTDAQAQLAEAREKIAAGQAVLDILRVAERAYGRDGIPALLVESVIGQLETDANRILEAMPTDDGTVFRLQLVTQREQKTTDTLKETLDILVSDGDTDRDYSTYSGGEKARVNIALRVALARLLASRRGAEVRLLAIDEPDGLDALGFAGLVDVVTGAAAAGEFDRVLLVSHHPDLQLAFGEQIRIVKRDGVSEIEGARVREVVAA